MNINSLITLITDKMKTIFAILQSNIALLLTPWKKQGSIKKFSLQTLLTILENIHTNRLLLKAGIISRNHRLFRIVIYSRLSRDTCSELPAIIKILN
ncbi:hypothetical protein DC094_20185 [Pelagibaculum spongiae]|uniref:Uncharacterized protein n=1 Tax=Pelagibaculum spongiae TaxID=2080658 RepID=A0A2V1GVU1_9GAMM|nr:hypothetical protein DC094_20185 [Pelagibaculum spongiae]